MSAISLQDVLTLIAVLVGPCLGVLLASYMENRARTTAEKVHVLRVMLMNKDLLPHPHEVVAVLNTIDVVFHGRPKVIDAWNSFYQTILFPDTAKHLAAWEVLLRAVASDIGYKNIKDINLNRVYRPQVQLDDLLLDRKIRGELLRVLEASETLSHPPQSTGSGPR
jgi:hypothetical protein